MTTLDPALNSRLGRAVRILLVEDSPSDRALTVAALREGRIANELYTATDGEMALRFVRAEAEFASAPRPDLIILDLNLPRKDGREVLEEIKAEERLKSIPVIVLTTSESEEDIREVYRLQAASYVSKPVGFDGFIAAVRRIEDCWLSLVGLPEPRD